MVISRITPRYSSSPAAMESELDGRIGALKTRIAQMDHTIEETERLHAEQNRNLNQMAQQVQQLRDQRSPSLKLIGLAQGATMACIVGAIGGVVLAFAPSLFHAHGALYPAVGLGGAVGCLYAGRSSMVWAEKHERQAMLRDMNRMSSLFSVKSMALLYESTSQQLQTLSQERQTMESELQHLGGQRDVVRMAQAPTPELVPVRLEDDYIMVGKIRIPRQR